MIGKPVPVAENQPFIFYLDYRQEILVISFS
jgi:hypothetical protein